MSAATYRLTLASVVAADVGLWCIIIRAVLS